MPENFKFYYFPLRCRGETARLLFAYAGVPYEDQRIPFDQWPSLKDKMPMGQMPVLDVNGRMICQSTAIARFLAKKFDLVGKDDIEAAVADMLVDGIFDLWGSIRPVYMALMAKNEETQAEEWAQFKTKHLEKFLERYTGFLRASKSGWFVGDQVTWADLAIAEWLSVLEDCFESDVLGPYPELKDFIRKVFTLPKIKEYVETRPKTVF